MRVFEEIRIFIQDLIIQVCRISFAQVASNKTEKTLYADEGA